MSGMGKPGTGKIWVFETPGVWAGTYIASTGLASARPAAAGSGALYFCTDVPIVYVDDPTTATWQGFDHNGYNVGGGPGPVVNWTVVGSVGLMSTGDAILSTAAVNNLSNQVLQPIPAGVTGAGPWKVTFTGEMSFTRGATFPEVGVCVSNGTTSGTSIALFCGAYQFSSNNMVPGAWQETLHTQTRPAIYFGDNTFTQMTGPWYFRILNDGTNYLYQYSQHHGAFWRTFFNNTVAGVGLTITDFGWTVGCVNGSGYASALVTGCSMQTLSQTAISNVTEAASLYTITTSTAHGLNTGDSVTITSVTGTGTNPNGVYENTVIVTNPTTFTLPAGGAFTYTSGGNVTLTSR